MRLQSYLSLALLGLVALSGCGNPADIPTTSDGAEIRQASPTDTAQDIVFVQSTTPENTDLFVMDETGANIRQLTSTPDIELFPAWSPDGTQIAFSYAGERDLLEGWPLVQVYTMRADGSERLQRTGTISPTMNDIYPVWSPDGTRIAYSTIAYSGIWTIDVNGSAPQRLTPEDGLEPSNENLVRGYSGPLAWSPDGSSFLIQDRGIVQIKPDGTILKRLTDSELDRDAAWSPDGKQIAFVRYSKEYNLTSFEVFIMDADGSNVRQLTNTPGLDSAPTWSADGKRIAFVSEGILPPSSGVLPRESSYPRPGSTALPQTIGPDPTATPIPTLTPAFLPTPQSAASPGVNGYPAPPVDNGYSMPSAALQPTPQPNMLGDIFVINVDGTGLTNLTNSPQQESYPAWRR